LFFNRVVGCGSLRVHLFSARLAFLYLSRVALGVVPFSRWRLGSRLDPGRWTCRCRERERHRESARAARTACCVVGVGVEVAVAVLPRGGVSSGGGAGGFIVALRCVARPALDVHAPMGWGGMKWRFSRSREGGVKWRSTDERRRRGVPAKEP
jgi:hypothetical protein